MNKNPFPAESIYKTEPSGLPPEIPRRGWKFGMDNDPWQHPTEVDLPLVLDDSVKPLRESLNDMFIYGKLGGPQAFAPYKLGRRRGAVLEGGFEELKRIDVPCYVFDRKFVLSFGGKPRYSPTIQSIYVRFVKKG